MTGLKAPWLDHFAFKGVMTLGGVEPAIARLRAGALAISGQGPSCFRAECRNRTTRAPGLGGRLDAFAKQKRLLGLAVRVGAGGAQRHLLLPMQARF